MRGRQFGELQEYLQTVNSAVVDIGASNVEELLSLKQRYRGSHEDFDCFILPTLPPLMQQQDTIASLIELARLGAPASCLKVVFNMTEAGQRRGAGAGCVLRGAGVGAGITSAALAVPGPVA